MPDPEPFPQQLPSGLLGEDVPIMPAESALQNEPGTVQLPDDGNPAAPPSFTSQNSLIADDGGAPHDDYTIVETYVFDEGVVQSPVASDDSQAESVFTRIHAPLQQLLVDWTATRTNADPQVPSAKRKDDNLVLLRRSIGKPNRTIMQNGQGFHVTITGSYLYGLRVPFDPEKTGIPGTTTPVTTEPREANDYDPSNFVDDLLS